MDRCIFLYGEIAQRDLYLHRLCTIMNLFIYVRSKLSMNHFLNVLYMDANFHITPVLNADTIKTRFPIPSFTKNPPKPALVHSKKKTYYFTNDPQNVRAVIIINR